MSLVGWTVSWIWAISLRFLVSMDGDFCGSVIVVKVGPYPISRNLWGISLVIMDVISKTPTRTKITNRTLLVFEGVLFAMMY